MCLNHPQTIPLPRSMEKLSSMKQVPGAKKVGDHWYIGSQDCVYLFAYLLLAALWGMWDLIPWPVIESSPPAVGG